MVRIPKPIKRNSAKAAPGSSLVRRVLAAAGLAALVLVIAVVALQIFAAEREAEHNLEQARLTATAAASRLNAEIEGLRRLLQTVAASLPDPIAGPEARALLDRTQASLGKSIRLRAIPAGVTEPDTAAPLPVSFATLELLHQAERGAAAIAGEMHRLGTPDAYLAVAVPIPGAAGSAARGLLIAALPGTAVQQGIDTLGRQAARIEAVQRVGGRGVTVAVSAGASPAQRPAAASVEIPGTILEVAYWPTPVDKDGWILTATIGGAAVLLVLLIGWAWGNWLRRAYAADGKVVVDSVRDLERFRREGSRQRTVYRAQFARECEFA